MFYYQTDLHVVKQGLNQDIHTQCTTAILLKNIKTQNFKMTVLLVLMPKVIDLQQPNIFSCPLQPTFSRAPCLVACAASVMLINSHHMERAAVIGKGPGVLVCEQTDLEQFHNIIPLLQPKANQRV